MNEFLCDTQGDLDCPPVKKYGENTLFDREDLLGQNTKINNENIKKDKKNQNNDVPPKLLDKGFREYL